MLGVAGRAGEFQARKYLCDRAVRGTTFALYSEIVTEHQSVGTRGDRGRCFSQPLPFLESEIECPPKATKLLGS